MTTKESLFEAEIIEIKTLVNNLLLTIEDSYKEAFIWEISDKVLNSFSKQVRVKQMEHIIKG